MKQKKYVNYLVDGMNGGATFSLAMLIYLLVTIVVSLVLSLTGAAGDPDFTSGYGYTYLSFLISPAAIAFTTVYATIKSKLNLARTCAYVKFRPRFLLITLLLFLGCLFGLSGVNTYFVGWLNELFGYTPQTPNLPSSGFGNYLLCLLVVCIIPAVFEETLFRGIVLNGCKRLGDTFACLITGAMFSLYHHSPQQTVYQFILGAVFALLVIRSGSILPSVIFHFLNNFYIITGYFIWGEELKIPVALSIVLTVIGLALFAFGLFLLIKTENPREEEEIKAEYLKIAGLKEERKFFLVSSLTGGAVCLILWIVELVTYIG